MMAKENTPKWTFSPQMFTPEQIEYLRQIFVSGNVNGAANGLTGTITFYAASTSGGSPTILHTVTVEGGIITSWTTK